jgi:hypothetical protein
MAKDIIREDAQAKQELCENDCNASISEKTIKDFENIDLENWQNHFRIS